MDLQSDVFGTQSGMSRLDDDVLLIRLSLLKL